MTNAVPNGPNAMSAAESERGGVRDAVVFRFAGDSGDGMLLTGLRFAAACALADNDVHSLPIYPSEIRAPSGSPFAVTAFQVRVGARPLHTPGDVVDVLFVMNPASLRLHLPDLAPGGLLVVNSDSFESAELERAGYSSNPLTDGTLSRLRVIEVPVHRLNREAVARVKLLSPREADRSRSFFALGLACQLLSRPVESTLPWIRQKFARNPVAIDANSRALQAGYDFGMTLTASPMTVASMTRPPGMYRRINGHEALSLGLVSAAHQGNRPLVFASCPMLPASELQQQLFDLATCGVRSVVAEDEMAAVGMALGAASAGAIGVTVTSGPGMGILGEMLGLAVMTELPLVVVNVMRAGAGNGIPNASDQGDLLQALFGRGGDSPLVVLAPVSPADAFDVGLHAVRLAIEAMTPVIVLTDVHLGQASQPWRVPAIAELPSFTFTPARPWVVPGTPEGEHRLTGLEHDETTGRVSFDPANHQRMTARRAAKIDRLAESVPAAERFGPAEAATLVIGWGSSAGPIREAVALSPQCAGVIVRSLYPLPANLETMVMAARRVIVAEANSGQLAMLLRSRYGIDVETCNAVAGRPLRVREILARIG